MNSTWHVLANSLLQQLKDAIAVQNTLLLAVAAIAAGCVAHVSSRRWVCSPDLSSRAHVFATMRVFATKLASPELSSQGVFARQRVFTTTRVLARPVFGTCLSRPRLFATLAFARPVFGNCLLARTWLHSCKCLGKGFAVGKWLRTPTCLRSEKCHDVSSPGCVFRRPRVFAVFTWHVSADA